MKIYFFIVCLAGTMTQKVLAQKHINNFPDYDHSLPLEAKSDTTANVSFGDFDGDGHLDILLVKGRHWPIVDRVLLGDGKGGIRKAYDLGKVSDRSYTGGLADFNGDGFLDIAISNDAPDRKLVYFNDGKGKFTANCIAFAPYPATTIYPADINKDGFIDLAVPHRDGGQSYVYLGSSDMAFSDTHRIPFGPSNATIRVAAVADFNGDGIPDIVTIDENKGVNIYFGQKDQTFSAGISLADSKGTVYGFAVGDFNEDGIPDIASARSDAPNVLYFGNIKSKNRK